MIGYLRGRHLFATLILTLGIVLAWTGCSDDDDDPVGPPATFAPPTNLQAVNGDGEVTLTWTGSTDEGQSEFRRYNLYRATSSIIGLEPSQLTPYLVQSVDPGVHTINAPVPNGTLYYYHVRGERTNGDLTSGSNEAMAAGRPEGEGLVIEEFASTGNSGFDFSEGLSVSLKQSNPDRFAKTDVYLGTGAANDSSSGELRLKSPHLLGVQSYRTVGIKTVGTTWGISTTTDDGWTDQVSVGADLVGLVYAVRIPATGVPANFAKIQITQVKSTPAGERAITFKYAYQPGENVILF